MRLLVIAGAMLLPACLGSTHAPDGDPWFPDRSVMLDRERLDLGHEDAGPRDLEPDLPHFGEAGPDLLQTDATLSRAEALYLLGATEDDMAVRTVSTDGTGTPVPVPGLTGLVDFDSIGVSSLAALLHGGTGPQPLIPGALLGVHLPADLGTIYYFHRKLTATSGLLLVRPDGQRQVLVETFGLYGDLIGPDLAISSDGAMGAVVQSPNVLQLFRCDGVPFASGAFSVPLAAPQEITNLLSRSVTVAGGYVYCIGATQEGAHRLLRAPVDGKADLAALPLPASDGSSPEFIAEEIAASAGSAYLVLAAGSDATATDIYLVEASSGAAANLTMAPGEHAPRGAIFGADEMKLAVSPQGTRVAFVRRIGAADELFVVEVGGSTTHITDPSRFMEEVIVSANLLFADDANLLFMAGVSDSQLDIFRWNAGDGKVAILTSSLSIVPFDGRGRLGAEGGWLSPDGKRATFVCNDVSGRRDIVSVDLVTFDVTPVYTHGLAQLDEGTFAVCPADNRVLFVGESIWRRQQSIWRFDQDSGKAAVKIAGPPPGAGPWTIGSLHVCPGCKCVLYSAGGAADLRTLWRAPVDPIGPPQQLTGVPRHFAPGMLVTPDGATVVFASGGTPEKTILRAVPLPGGNTADLDPAAGLVRILAAY